MNYLKLKKIFLFLITLTGLLAFNTVRASNQVNSISGEEASAILLELKQIRSVLERIEKKSLNSVQAGVPARPKITKISSINRPSLGSSDAPVTIVAISDYQCPYCKRFADTTMKDLKKDYIDTGKVRIVFKDYPLAFHAQAKKVAQAAHCAGDQGKYWQMHNILFQDIKKTEASDFINNASQLTLDTKTFKHCISGNRHYNAIEKDIADATQAGLSGTPSFVIGKTTRDIIEGDVIAGAHSISSLKKYIEKYM
ncbi:hypothetical protein MNBD_GAMMA09-480 [hydrothermal vent metagenome]|uniref:Thioredoxin domain-containing protein n=1 Tax=hydrothermal vent metagenome TaxID=652676 RepID=A0A3B0XCD1_9ZZZZ